MIPRLVSVVLGTAFALGAQTEQVAQSKKKEAVVWRSMADDVRARGRIVEHANALELVERVGERLAAQLPSSPRFTFALTKGDPYGDPTAGINRAHEPLALPSGDIFVPVTLLLTAQSEGELAGMLAHALLHVAEDHYVRKPMSGNAGLTMMVSPASSSRMVPPAFLPEVQSFEASADLLSVSLLSKAGYDPVGFRNYLARIRDPRNPAQAKWPLRDDRLAAIDAAIEQLGARDYSADDSDFAAVQKEIHALFADPPMRPPTLRRPGERR